jgi:acetyltransferase-like isoleucine patch superfamily enzyme
MMRKILARLVEAYQGVKSRWRNLYYRILGVRLGGYVWMRQIEIPRNYQDIEIGPGAALDRGVVLLCSGPSSGSVKIRIGPNTYINRRTMLDATQQLEIGSNCALGPGCYLTDHDHGLDPTLPPLGQPMIHASTRLGNEVWLGANVIVLKGVTIGDRAVVGAGSVVTQDIPADAVAVGVPARVVRLRTTLPTAATPSGGAQPRMHPLLSTSGHLEKRSEEQVVQNSREPCL